MTSKRGKKNANPKTRKPKVETPDVDASALLEFLTKKAGGEGKATTAFIRESMAGMVKRGATFGAMMDQAKTEGWDSVLKDTPVKAVLGTTVKPVAKGPGRKEDLAMLQMSIRMKLQEGPLTAADLAKYLDIDRKQLTRQLAKLAEDGVVKAEGSRRQRTYSLDTTKT